MRFRTPMSDPYLTIPRARVVMLARTWAGTPYHHQASTKAIGTDCLGLVRGIWRELYGSEPVTVPGYSRDWAEASGCETLYDAARAHFTEIPTASATDGDVLLFRWRKNAVAKHVGILMSRDRLIHAFEGVPVTEIKMTSWWWRHAAAAFRFPGVID
jgi:NlpC/P60 family putative phage cell wall peptidase